jgi:acyl-CoA thioester hydrolase
MSALPYPPYRASVRAEWIDYNGHMNVAYYVPAFDRATDCLLDYLEIGENYRRARNCSVFVLEAHVTYERELHAGDTFTIDTQLIDADRKRLHLFHAMAMAETGIIAATTEIMTLHVDLATSRSATLPDEAFTKIEALLAAHRLLPPPPQLGRKIGIRR